MSERAAATLKDVAALAGVSTAAASFALRGRPGVSEATRERVAAAAAELHYSTNIAARNLRTQATAAIGLYLPGHVTSSAYYMDVAFGVAAAAHERDLAVVLLPNTPDARAAAAHVDGFIVVDVADDDPGAIAILAGRRPVVSGEHVATTMVRPSGSVVSDHDSAMTALLDHLRSSGARHVAILAPPLDTAWGRDIRQAFERWSAANGTEALLAEVPFATEVEAVAAACTDLLLGHPGIDAIIAVPDGSASCVLPAAKAIGRIVGEDLLVAAYVDSAGNRLLDPPVTAFDLRPRAFGEACAELLASILDGTGPTAGSPEATEIADIELVIRRSSVPAALAHPSSNG